MTSVQRKRAWRFVGFLRRLPRKHFNMSHWVVSDTARSAQGCLIAIQDEVNSCGTTACALGHLPVFNPKVFAYKAYYSEIWEQYKITNGIKVRGKRGYQHPTDIAEDYFGIPENICMKIFVNKKTYKGTRWDRVTPVMVAAKLEQYLKNGEL